jgi:hypothetical protein
LKASAPEFVPLRSKSNRAGSDIDDGLRVAPLKIQVKEPLKSNNLSSVAVSKETDESNHDRSSEQYFGMSAVEVPEIATTRTPYPSVDTAENEDRRTVRKPPTTSFNTNKSTLGIPTDTLKNTQVSFEQKQQQARSRIETSTSYTSLPHSDISNLQSEALTAPHPEPIKITTREAVKEQRRREKAERKAASLRKRAVRRLRGRIAGEGMYI